MATEIQTIGIENFKAVITQPNNKGMTPYQILLRYSNKENFNEAELTAAHQGLGDSLHTAAAHRDQNGNNSLHFACRAQNSDAVATMLKEKQVPWSDLVVVTNRRGWNVLHYCARSGDSKLFIMILNTLNQPQVSEALLTAGTGPYSTPMDLICRYGNKEMLESAISRLTTHELNDFLQRHKKGVLESYVNKNPQLTLPNYQSSVTEKTCIMDVFNYLMMRSKYATRQEDYNHRLQDFIKVLNNINDHPNDLLNGAGNFYKKNHYLFSGTERYQQLRSNLVMKLNSTDNSQTMLQEFREYLAGRQESCHVAKAIFKQLTAKDLPASAPSAPPAFNPEFT